MKTVFRRASVALAIVFFIDLATTTTSQGEDDTTTYYTNGLVNVVAGNVTNGVSGTNNLLQISNATTLTNSGDGFIGFAATADGNTTLVSDTGSLWSVAGNLFPGYNGADNRLIITNGGQVRSGGGYIGYASSSASSNIVSITGPGSLWAINSILYIGNNSAGNQLILSDGGVLTNLAGGFSTVLGGSATGNNNLLFITGAGSTFYNGNDFSVGSAGNSNRVVIESGGKYVGPNFRFGSSGGSYNMVILTNGGLAQTAGVNLGEGASSHDNRAIVSGSASMWTNSGAFILGLKGTNQSLRIENGGKLYNGTTFEMGGYFGSTSTSNDLVVTGAGSLLNSGSDLRVGWGGNNHRVTVEDGGVINHGGSAWFGYGGAGPTSNNVGLVTGTGSLWSVATDFYVGHSGGGHQLTVADGGKVQAGANFISGNFGSGNRVSITNGGVVQSTQGLVGYQAGANSNSVNVEGAGSVWTNSSILYVGLGGASNALNVVNGGKVYASITYVSWTGTNSLLLLTGSNSLWQNSGAAYVGFGGQQGQVIVSNGAQAVSAGAYLSYNVGSRSNSVTVTGNGSLWSIAGDFYVGNSDLGNSLTIADGGSVVQTGNGIIGNSASSSNNTVLLTGSGTVWRSGNVTYLGSGSSHNRMTIADGATLINTNANNHVISGVAGHENILVVTNGGQVVSYGGIIGNTGNDNTVIITGAGSVWTNKNLFYVGNNGRGNHLEISDGGGLYSHVGNYVGLGAGSSNNSVLITGAGSFWQSAGDNFVVGNSGTSNHLTVADGGQVRALQSIIGNAAAGSRNEAVVTGDGSMISNNLAMYVGNIGSDNRLTITNGGQVSGTTVIIGNSTGSNNVVRVTGTGSHLEARTSSDFHVGNIGSNNLMLVEQGGLVSSLGNLYLGGNVGSFNQVVVTNGGLVRSLQTVIGNIAASTGNKAIVSGIGSVWTNTSFDVYVGNQGTSNQLVVSDGGQFYSRQGRVGNTASSQGNSVLVTGPGSYWQMNNELTVGSNGVTSGGGRVLVTDGGTLEAPVFRAGFNGSGIISNVGGIYQFATASPLIVTNFPNAISITDGTISYRNVSAASIFNADVAKMAFDGDNTFRLLSSSNSSIATYTFDTGLGATNYHRLELVNGTTRWTTTGGTTIGAGGSVLASNTVATIAGTLTIHGSYVSDPSTNIFLNDVTIGQSGTLAGGVGDLFEYRDSLFIHVTNNSQFQLDQSAVLFSGGGIHTNEITGLDLGSGPSAYDAAFTLGTNFAYGELRLGSAADEICFFCGNIPVIPNNALYVGWLDLLGDTNLVDNLHADSSINIYYYIGDSRNAYLGGQTFQLTECDGVTLGGFLMPVIPEPSALILVAVAAVALFRKRNR